MRRKAPKTQRAAALIRLVRLRILQRDRAEQKEPIDPTLLHHSAFSSVNVVPPEEP